MSYPVSGSIKVVYTLGATTKEFVIINGSVTSADKQAVYDYVYNEVTDKVEVFRNIGVLKRLLSMLS